MIYRYAGKNETYTHSNNFGKEQSYNYGNIIQNGGTNVDLWFHSL
jgi:hypothetical protein